MKVYLLIVGVHMYL